MIFGFLIVSFSLSAKKTAVNLFFYDTVTVIKVATRISLNFNPSGHKV